MEIILLILVIVFCFVLPACFALWSRRTMKRAEVKRKLSHDIDVIVYSDSGVPVVAMNKYAKNGEMELNYNTRSGKQDFSTIPLYVKRYSQLKRIDGDS